MGTICINGLKLFAYHGVNPEEKEHGQDFILDVRLVVDLSNAMESDDLTDTVSYAAVIKTIKRSFIKEKYNLIERAAKVTCEDIFKEHPTVKQVALTLKKPNAPINAAFDYVAVEIIESRSDQCHTQF